MLVLTLLPGVVATLADFAAFGYATGVAIHPSGNYALVTDSSGKIRKIAIASGAH